MEGFTTRASSLPERSKSVRALYDMQLERASNCSVLDYYELVMAWNARLHLVAPCAPAEFATRHVLESLLALSFLDEGARVVDVGSGAGLPVIPCFVARPDLRATLVESSQKKAVFLREALARPSEARRGASCRRAIREGQPPRTADVLTCRALERFTEIFPQLTRMGGARQDAAAFRRRELCASSLRKRLIDYQSLLVPESERRFLFVVKRQVANK